MINDSRVTCRRRNSDPPPPLRGSRSMQQQLEEERPARVWCSGTLRVPWGCGVSGTGGTGAWRAAPSPGSFRAERPDLEGRHCAASINGRGTRKAQCEKFRHVETWARWWAVHPCAVSPGVKTQCSVAWRGRVPARLWVPLMCRTCQACQRLGTLLLTLVPDVWVPGPR